MEHSSQAAAAQREVTDMTNELLKKNAEKLKLATVETAKESERGIVDIETLQQTNASLISTFDEVMQIQEEGRKKRLEAEKKYCGWKENFGRSCWRFESKDLRGAISERDDSEAMTRNLREMMQGEA